METAEVFQAGGSMYLAAGFDPPNLGTAMADLYRDLCLPDRPRDHGPKGIRFHRRESEHDPVLESLIHFSEGVNALYQSRPKPEPPQIPSLTSPDRWRWLSLLKTKNYK